MHRIGIKRRPICGRVVCGRPWQARGSRAGSLAALASLVALALGATPARAAVAPTVGGSWASEVAATTATLDAEVNPNGSATTYRFEYITEAAYEANINEGVEPFSGATKQPAGSGANLGKATTFQPAVQHVGPLAFSTTYRYQVVATNTAGTAIGPTQFLTTQESSPVSTLLDGRGWEMVSPIEKNGGAIQGFGGNFGGDVLQAAAGGGAITYSSASSFGEAPEGAPPVSQYISSRDEGGWSTQNISTPTVSGAYGAEPNGVPYQLFSPDLSAGLLLGSRRCRGEGEECPVANPPLAGTEAPAGYVDYYLRNDTSAAFEALLTGDAVAGLTIPPEQFEMNFSGATVDLHHVIVSTCAALTDDAVEVPGPEGCNSVDQNLYEWSEGQLKLVNLLPGQDQGMPGASPASQSGAISTDGSRVFFAEGGNLYLRDGGRTVQVDEAQGGGGEFQTASSDGSVAFFTKNEHLYRYELSSELASDITPEGEVQGVVGASEDGLRVYYVSTGGLYLWHAGSSTHIAPAAAASDFPPTSGTARLTADGTRLLFLSAAPLTGYDNTDANTGQPDSEVYLYDANSANLTCLSCNRTNERPIGPSTVPPSVANGGGSYATDVYKPRSLSLDGRRVFFDSRDALTPQDTDNRPDVYEWEANGEGSCQRADSCLQLVSSGRSSEGASFVDASANGSDAFFLTSESIVNSDPGSVDIYDARMGGGFTEPPKPIPCEADSCQPLPEAPEDPTVGTLIPGPSNPPPSSKGSACPEGKHRTVRHGRARCVPKRRHAKRRHRKRGGHG